MKVSNNLIEKTIKPSVRAACIRKDDRNFAPVSNSVTNIFHYLNLLNRDLKVNAVMHDERFLSDLMMPSGLSNFLEPRRIMMDTNDVLSPNLRLSSEYTAEDVALPSGYDFTEFQKDVKVIALALGVRDIECNTSVAQCIRDVNIDSVVDKLVIANSVIWSGSQSTAFIPLKVVPAYTCCISKDAYNRSADKMIEEYFNSLNIAMVFSK